MTTTITDLTRDELAAILDGSANHGGGVTGKVLDEAARRLRADGDRIETLTANNAYLAECLAKCGEAAGLRDLGFKAPEIITEGVCERIADLNALAAELEKCRRLESHVHGDKVSTLESKLAAANGKVVRWHEWAVRSLRADPDCDWEDDQLMDMIGDRRAANGTGLPPEPAARKPPFEWTAEDKARVVLGSTVVWHWCAAPASEGERFTIDRIDGAQFVNSIGEFAYVQNCDPQSLITPEPAKPVEMPPRVHPNTWELLRGMQATLDEVTQDLADIKREFGLDGKAVEPEYPTQADLDGEWQPIIPVRNALADSGGAKSLKPTPKVGDTVRCNWGDGEPDFTAEVIAEDCHGAPYQLRYMRMQPVERKSWAEAKHIIDVITPEPDEPFDNTIVSPLTVPAAEPAQDGKERRYGADANPDNPGWTLAEILGKTRFHPVATTDLACHLQAVLAGVAEVAAEANWRANKAYESGDRVGYAALGDLAAKLRRLL